MPEGFDFTTDDVLDWEVEAIWAAIDQETLIFTRHAREELSLDALTLGDVLDAISFPDEITKDLPGGTRVPGLNFDRYLGEVRMRAKISWKERYYLVITVMAN